MFRDELDVSDLGSGKYVVRVEPGWDIGGRTNGGYLLALCAKALSLELDRPDPVSITCHFLRPVESGEYLARTEVLKRGKGFSTARMVLHRADSEHETLVGITGTFSDHGTRSAQQPFMNRSTSQIPQLPKPEECFRLNPADGPAPSIASKVGMWLHPDDARWTVGQPSGRAQVRGWFSHTPTQPLDILGVLMACDTFPPTIFNAGIPAAWTPTIELTAHLRRRPNGQWLRAKFETRHITDGFLEESGELWDETGALVAQSRQLALIPRSANDTKT